MAFFSVVFLWLFSMVFFSFGGIFFTWQPILSLDPAYKCICSPSDTLQYLSQLESVARKLKDQLIRQNQVILRIKVMRFSFVMA